MYRAGIRGSNDALMSIKSLAIQNIPINLSCTYKGLHLEQSIRPLSVGSDYVAFQTPKLQMCYTMHDWVYLHSRILPETVRAEAEMISSTTRQMKLKNFIFMGSPWRDRQEQRVQPAYPIPVDVSKRKQGFGAVISNLSIHGIAMMIYPERADLPEINYGDDLDLDFQLNVSTGVSLRSKVIAIRRAGELITHLGVRLFPTYQQEHWLENFITTRKIEILNELEQNVRDKLEPPRAKDLYF